MRALDLRRDGRAIFDQALRAVDPAQAVRRVLRVEEGVLRAGAVSLEMRGRVRVFGAGKAFASMAQAVEVLLGDAVSDGLGIVKDGCERPLSRVALRSAAHPVPDARGLAATEEMLRMLAAGRPDDLVVFLLSGGASALLEAPAAGVSLADLQAVNSRLLRCGADIGEINAVRKRLSRVKGGRLARHLGPARCVALVLSDVLGSPLDQIGSGPLVADPTGAADARFVVRAHGIEGELPASVRARLGEDEGGRPPVEVPHVIVADNGLMAREAVRSARSAGYRGLLLSDRLCGDAEELGRRLAGLARQVPRRRPVCVVGSGETTVRVRGAGRGGRNQHLALSFALGGAGLRGCLLLAGASDGTDGPTAAAGAFADGGTVRRGARRGLSAALALQECDAGGYFEALGDLLVTGPTGTNTNDLYLLMLR